MTLAPHIPPLVTRPFRPRSLEVRWSAVRARPRGPARVALVVTVHTLDTSRALLEAWLEDETGARDLIVRQPTPCRVVSDGELLHIDVQGADRDGPPWLAVSVVEGDGSLDLLYARSSLLERAKLAPGGYDPPEARVVSEGAGAASA
jgi:hypothetical protein